MPLLHPGDIGCVAKLRTRTRTTRSPRASIRFACRRSTSPSRSCVYAVHATARDDEEKLQQGLHRLHDEDPSFETHYNRRDARDDRRRHGRAASRGRDGEAQAEVRRVRPSSRSRRSPIARRSRQRRRARAATRSSRAAAGSSATAGCASRPTPRGAGYQFVDEIVGGSIPSKFIPAVDKGIQEAAARGVLAGYPMVDFQVELFDGSYHSVDSNEMSFKMAGILAFKTVAPKCKPVLLEPLDEVEVTTPDQFLGDVLGDLSSRRGQILGTDSLPGGSSRVRAIVPQAELHLYATDLHSMTHGHGNFAQRFKGYEQMPGEAAQRVINETKGSKEAVG